jgi:hypothetical protein
MEQIQDTTVQADTTVKKDTKNQQNQLLESQATTETEQERQKQEIRQTREDEYKIFVGGLPGSTNKGKIRVKSKTTF